MKLVLFDIDGTLLHCGGATREPFAQALEEVCGTAGSLRSDAFAGHSRLSDLHPGWIDWL